MQEALKLMIVIGILEGFSSGLGGALTYLIKIKSDNTLASLYAITAGMMTAIVCFDMLPESFEISNVYYSIIWIIVGVLLIILLDMIYRKKSVSPKSLSKTSLILIIAMSAHNITEGLAIGAGASYSFALGLSILISIFLHNIPEGMVVGISMRLEKKTIFQNLKYCILVGIPTGFGAFIGRIIGNISDKWIAASLSLSAGAMLYIVSCDLIPNSQKLTKNVKVYLTYIVGVIFGILATNIL